MTQMQNVGSILPKSKVKDPGAMMSDWIPAHENKKTSVS